MPVGRFTGAWQTGFATPRLRVWTTHGLLRDVQLYSVCHTSALLGWDVLARMLSGSPAEPADLRSGCTWPSGPAELARSAHVLGGADSPAVVGRRWTPLSSPAMVGVGRWGCSWPVTSARLATVPGQPSRQLCRGWGRSDSIDPLMCACCSAVMAAVGPTLCCWMRMTGEDDLECLELLVAWRGCVHASSYATWMCACFFMRDVDVCMRLHDPDLPVCFPERANPVCQPAAGLQPGRHYYAQPCVCERGGVMPARQRPGCGPRSTSTGLQQCPGQRAGR